MKRILSLLPLLLLTSSAPLISACESSPTGEGCCRVCRQGKACGDTCISENDTCTVGPGCACNG